MYKKLNIYVVGGDTTYVNWMVPSFGKVVNSLNEADLVVFTGGADVSPELYNEEKGLFTSTSSDRDLIESQVFKECSERGKLMVGICRGLQFGAVMSGAKLVQHMHHPSKHRVTLYDGTKLYTNSYHHQLVKPFNLTPDKYDIIAYAEGLSDYYYNGSNSTSMMPSVNGYHKEPEIVLFNETNFLGIQAHPEMLDINSKFVQLCRALLRYHIEGILGNLVTLKIPIERLLAENLSLSVEENKVLSILNRENEPTKEYIN